jgi:hypothetical protein
MKSFRGARVVIRLVAGAVSGESVACAPVEARRGGRAVARG